MPTWMVVEDEPDIYDVLLAMFEMWGIEGIAFVDGEEALAWIDDVDRGLISGELPEMALLDIRLPTSSGPEIGARLRKSPRLRNMTIVLITAFKLSIPDEEQAKRLASADLLLYKPFPPMPEMRARLVNLQAKRKAAALKESVPGDRPAPQGKTSKENAKP